MTAANTRTGDITISDSECEDRFQAKEPSLLGEFKAALAQQTFGIDQYETFEDTGTAIKASLTLSDSRICTIELSKQGYEVLSLLEPTEEPGRYKNCGNSQFPVFESLDSLLREVSPQFNAAWEKSLLERLNALQKPD